MQLMAAYQEFSEPDEHHKQIARKAGDWDTTVKVYMMGPDAEPVSVAGKSSCRMINGNRVLLERVTSEGMPGHKFEGLGLTGYDRLKKKYVTVWTDCHGTTIALSHGEPDASGNKITFHDEHDDPRGNGVIKSSAILELGDTEHHLTMFHEDEDGKDVKVMEVIYNKPAKAASAGMVD